MVAAQTGDPLELLRRMKFETIGFHPIDGCALNFIEQINQTWTYAVALAAARQLMELHPGLGGYRLAPGANASLPLDIMSEADRLVGAEAFAAVDPRNNRKLAKDLTKMAARTEEHRYVFLCRLYTLEQSASSSLSVMGFKCGPLKSPFRVRLMIKRPIELGSRMR